MANQTLEQYNQIIVRCRDIYSKKTKDYGTSWRIQRPSSLTDQLFIKAKRIRGIEERGVTKVKEGVEGEYMGLVNYGLMALIQLDLTIETGLELGLEKAEQLYDKYVNTTRELMLRKNHDYGEAWRDMRITSLTDLILTKLLRVKRIEDNQGRTLISEGVAANYQDIINYAIFALIKLEEQKLKIEN